MLTSDRHLKWRALDGLERALMVLCGICLAGFSTAVFFDVLTREIGHPWLWLQEVTSAFFTYGIFCGTGVAVRRNDHLYLSAIAAQLSGRMRRPGSVQPRRGAGGRAGDGRVRLAKLPQGFGSFRMPSLTPIAYLYWPIPVAARWSRCSAWSRSSTACATVSPPPITTTRGYDLMVAGNALILGAMTVLFLTLGYLGVPVAFSLIAGVLVGTAFTPITFQSIIGQLFNGIDSESLMAIPFFLLVGELMTSANVVIRIAELSQAMVGHIRGGLAQVTTVFSMFFSGMSGSSSADVAVLSRTMARPMAQEGYSPQFVAALIAAASTIAALVPPSIMAVVYGAIGNVSIAGLFLGGVVARPDDRHRADDLLLLLRSRRLPPQAGEVRPTDHRRRATPRCR